MTSKRAIETAISSGLKSLLRQQQPDGNFTCYTPLDPAGHVTTFIPSLISIALHSVSPSTQLSQIQGKITAQLMAEKSPNWSINYWPRGSEAYTKIPYPDDLDATFCALAALHLANPELLQPSDYAAIVKLLVSQEQDEGGPYFTWLVDAAAGKAWRDIDLAVNANIAYFISIQDIHLPSLTAYLEDAIAAKAFTTPYYPSFYPVIYFISRFYRGQHRQELRSFLLLHKNAGGTWANPTDTALAVSALLNLGEPPAGLDSAVAYLLAAQNASGWAAGVVYTEGDGQELSSTALTTALACEALSKYAGALKPATAQPKTNSKIPDTIYHQAVGQVQARFASLDIDIRREAATALERLLRQDGDRQIILLPYVWQQSLKPAQLKMNPKTLVDLGAASLFGWTAYTIYDDFLDEEAVPKQLPVANVSLRALAAIFNDQAAENPAHLAFINSILDEIESANAWEVSNCRVEVSGGVLKLNAIPDYGSLRRLAQRSFGHALGPICLLLRRGHAPDSLAITKTLEFFEHYLIARQLNDDVHDWESDLGKGHINAVAAILLKNAGYHAGEVPIEDLVTQLRDNLWNTQIRPVCQIIGDHLALAEQALVGNPALKNSSALTDLLIPLRRSIDLALEGQAASLEFIQAFEH